MPHRTVLALMSAFALAGCNTTGPAAAPPAPAGYTVPGVTPAGFKLPEGTGCAAETARFRAIQDNDLKSGHVSKSVYDQIGGEISQAEAACAAGRDGEARAMIAASRKRHGYPG